MRRLVFGVAALAAALRPVPQALLRVTVLSTDASGRQRNSTLEIAAGDATGPWSSWQGDVANLRLRPAPGKEVRVVAAGGGVRFDNVAPDVP